MSWDSFVVEMSKALAWPAVAVLLGVLIGRPLLDLLAGLKLHRLRKGDWEAEFREQSEALHAEIGDATQTPSPTSKPQALLSGEPVHEILASWSRLESTVTDVAARAQISSRNLTEALRGLTEKGFIETSTHDAIMGLRNLRNLAVHAPDQRLTATRAREFVAMADAVEWSVRENVKKRRTASPGA